MCDSVSESSSVEAYRSYMHAGHRLSPRRTGPVVVFAGPADSGKSRLLWCAMRGEPPRHEPEPTILDELHDRVNSTTEVTVVDTGGHHDYFQLAAEQLAECTLAVLVFDASRPHTVHAVAKYALAVTSFNENATVDVIVCANKLDRVASASERADYLGTHPEVRRVLDGLRESCPQLLYVETRCEGPGPHRSVRQLRDLIASLLPLASDRSNASTDSAPVRSAASAETSPREDDWPPADPDLGFTAADFRARLAAAEASAPKPLEAPRLVKRRHSMHTVRLSPRSSDNKCALQ